MDGRTGYKRIEVPHQGSGDSRSVSLAVLAASGAVLDALEAYRKARRGERGGLEVRDDEIEWTDSVHGRLKLRWREEQDFACSLERRGEALSATVGFRLEPGAVVLEMLDESALGERVDEI